jgi:hypothetical protein
LSSSFTLRLLPERFVVERLAAEGAVVLPPSPFATVVRRDSELTRIRPEGPAPDEVAVLESSSAWRGLVIEASFDFEAVGVLATLSAALAGAGVPLLAISTWATDVILVAEPRLAGTLAALREAGHEVVGG